MNYWKVILALFSATMLGVTSYYFGQRSAHQQAESLADKTSKNLEEVAQAELAFQSSQKDLTNRLAEVKNKIKTVKQSLELEEGELELESVEIAQKLTQLSTERAQLGVLSLESDVPVPAGSPDGIILNQPKSPSGISLKVLENYEQDTGVSPQEIEELMRRTE